MWGEQMKMFIDWLLHSQAAKTAGAAAGGSIASITMLLGVMEQRLETQIKAKHEAALVYVDRRYDVVSANIELVKSELVFIKTGQAETNTNIRILSDRIFDMNRRSKD
jgi:hypothetical protein